MDAADALQTMADYAKQDNSFHPRASSGTTRWHATVKEVDFELLCNGPKFFDSKSGRGGGGAVDLSMHLFQLDFKQALAVLHDRKL